ncbi:MAG: helicase C-terminal domain-containing protein, partial [archaeon]
IRTMDDYGTVIICDKRIDTKKYGKIIYNSLPDAKYTNSFQDVSEIERKDKIVNSDKVVPLRLFA